MLGPGERVGIPRIACPLGPLERPEHHRPESVWLHTEQHELTAVLGHVVVRDRVRGGATIRRNSLEPELDGAREIERHHVTAETDQGGGDHLAIPRSLALEQRRRDPCCCSNTGHVIPHAAALAGHVLARQCQRRCDTRPRPEHAHVEARPVHLRALETERRQTGVDEAGEALADRLMIEAIPQQRVPAHVRDEHVRVLEQVHEDGLALIRGVVEGDSSLATVVHLERWILGTPDCELKVGPEASIRIAGEWFHLDDVCTPVAEDRRSGRCGHPEPHLDDLDSLHRTHDSMVGHLGCPRPRDRYSTE
ncbi:unannotated protein [freshwater metagenome]|uniref:Unannotated protein n=1 Tax=freshwater metagenome TaxID=449393 RepID=A0A6J6RJ24_9ZZZZ